MMTMRTPSIKTLSMVFNNPREAKRILTLSRAELLRLDTGRTRNAECYNPPPTTADLRMTCLNAIDACLHGVESAETTEGEYATYLNTGDSYASTVIYWRGRYRVQSLGDFIETLERRAVRFR